MYCADMYEELNGFWVRIMRLFCYPGKFFMLGLWSVRVHAIDVLLSVYVLVFLNKCPFGVYRYTQFSLPTKFGLVGLRNYSKALVGYLVTSVKWLVEVKL